MKAKFSFLIIFLFHFGFQNFAIAQISYRFRADFSIKEKTASGKSQLTLGEVFYDKPSGKLTYYATFPEKQILILVDTSLYTIKPGKPMQRISIPNISTYSVFQLALEGQLADFGLSKSAYKPESVTNEKDLVITCWAPPASLSKKIGKIYISTQNKKLYGVAYMNTQNKLVSKTIFSNFTVVNGVLFPCEVLQINYIDNKENYQKTTYKNIRINEFAENDKYLYPLPKF